MMILRQHLPAILLMIAIGVASGLPQYLLIQKMGAEYQGIFPATSGDDRYYEARSQEVRDGYPLLGNPYIYELRGAPAVAFWMPDAALSLAGEALGLDVQHTFALFDFLIPAILFLLSYAILLTATGSRLTSLLGAGLFHLGMYLDSFIRSPSPQLNFLFVELAILAVVRLVSNKPYAAYELAVALGVLFYVYPYYWTFVYGCVGIFFLATLAHTGLRNFRDNVFIALLGGVVIGLPSLLETLFSGGSTAYQETITRLGMIHSHTPAGLGGILISAVVLMVYAGAVTYLPFFRARPMSWLWGCMVVGGVLAANNQIVTGRNLEFSSHYFLPVAYIGLLAFVYVAYMAGQSLDRKTRPYAGLVACMLAVAIATSGGMTVAALIDPSLHTEEQRYGPIVSWLSSKVAPESVVLASENLSEFIPAYTSLRIFYSRNANLHVMTDDEAWGRFLLQYGDAELDDAFLFQRRGAIWGAYYQDEYGRISQLNKLRTLLRLPLLPGEELPQAAREEFRAFAAHRRSLSPTEALAGRRIDYAVAEPGYAIPAWVKKVYPSMDIVFEHAGFTVYKLEK